MEFILTGVLIWFGFLAMGACGTYHVASSDYWDWSGLVYLLDHS